MSATSNTTTSRIAKDIASGDYQPIDYRKLYLSMSASGGTTPALSFARATISSAAKTRGSTEIEPLNNLCISPQHTSFTPKSVSPSSTPTLLRSRSLRMSGKHRANHYGRASRTPEICSFNSSDLSSSSHESTQSIRNLESKIVELRENCEFLEKECQVLNDTLKELEEDRHQERTAWTEELKSLKQDMIDAVAEKLRLESELNKLNSTVDDLKLQLERTQRDFSQAQQDNDLLRNERDSVYEEIRELKAINKELKHMITDRLILNGETPSSTSNNKAPTTGNIVSDFARLKLELEEKEKAFKELQQRYIKHRQVLEMNDQGAVREIQQLDQMLDQAIDTVKSWPQAFRDDPHVLNLMRVLSIQEKDISGCH